MSKLTKDLSNRFLFGVCSGLSKYSGIDPTIIRLGFIFGAIFSGSLLLWIYIILAIILPKEA
jgi:phage shock protein PspC (stress-responsive transcriptional regulator)